MLHTRLCDVLGVEHPVLNAPMAGSATAELAAAVSAAGGFGLIGGTSPGGAAWLRADSRGAGAHHSPFWRRLHLLLSRPG
jgi:nitronate monooxygenase